MREALAERETLLRAMPHISWPMRFVLPLGEGRRPAWLVRLGLLLYDNLGGRRILPGTRTLDLRRDRAGGPLKPRYRKAFEYSDCWVEDSRLVALNARDAVERGARVLTRTRVERAERIGDVWAITLARDGAAEMVSARALVNAGGPWVADVMRDVVGSDSREKVRLVRGSHIVTRRLFDHDRSYFLQGADGRIVFAIPYETDFTLIGTTEEDHRGSPADARCTDAEANYLCAFASEYFAQPVTRGDIVWTYSGVRAAL